MFVAYFLLGAMMIGVDQLAPISVYDGGWTITATTTMAGAGKPDELVNHCSRATAYYACEQVVNGKPMALIVFTATEVPGKFHTQVVLPDGFSTGRGDLTISDNHWTFLGKDVEKDKTTYFRTENYFTGRDKIHFEQYESTDNKTWVKKNEGDEVRASK